MQEMYSLLLFVAFSLLAFILFRHFHYNPMLLEGMTASTDASGVALPVPENGMAGNAAAYASALKASVIKTQDTFLISKYRADYESAILNLDDLISNLMLKTVLTVDLSNPTESIVKLGQMQQAKTALNTVMKFVDAQ